MLNVRRHAQLDRPVRVCQGVAEQALVIDCAAESLIGVMSLPEGPLPAGATAANQLGVVIVVGGPQYRVGSHRQFVQLARAVAAAGHVALRFDVRGMGDSGGAAADFERIEPDIAAAIEALMSRCPGLRGVVLYGLCDGASAALMFVQAHPHSQVAGLAVCNPWVRSPATQAATQVKHYYMQRLRDPAFWRKLWRGQVAAGALLDWWRQWRLSRSLLNSASSSASNSASSSASSSSSNSLSGNAAQPSGPQPSPPIQPAEAKSFQERMASGWAGYQAPLLLQLSGNDYTAREFCEAVASQQVWRGALNKTNLTRHDLAGADHTLSEPTHSRQAEQQLVAWLQAWPVRQDREASGA